MRTITVSVCCEYRINVDIVVSYKFLSSKHMIVVAGIVLRVASFNIIIVYIININSIDLNAI